MAQMRRRDFVTLLSGATAWVAAAGAQEPRRVIGVLGSASYGAFPGTEAAFIEGLRAVGFIEGENISIEWLWAGGQYDRLSSLAGELVGPSDRAALPKRMVRKVPTAAVHKFSIAGQPQGKGEGDHY